MTDMNSIHETCPPAEAPAVSAEPLPLTAPEKGRGTVTLVVILALVAVFVGMAAGTLLLVWAAGLLEAWLNMPLASLGG